MIWIAIVLIVSSLLVLFADWSAARELTPRPTRQQWHEDKEATWQVPSFDPYRRD
jgi:hypothetical protein